MGTGNGLSLLSLYHTFGKNARKFQIRDRRKDISVLFPPQSITVLVDWEDARNGCDSGRPSPQAIRNGGQGYRSLANFFNVSINSFIFLNPPYQVGILFLFHRFQISAISLHFLVFYNVLISTYKSQKRHISPKINAFSLKKI